VLFRSYMNSRSHRANILNPRVTVIGIHTKRVSSGAWNVLDFVNNYLDSYGGTRSSC
jgi:uncharacterized protein YkwD